MFLGADHAITLHRFVTYSSTYTYLPRKTHQRTRARSAPSAPWGTSTSAIMFGPFPDDGKPGFANKKTADLRFIVLRC